MLYPSNDLIICAAPPIHTLTRTSPRRNVRDAPAGMAGAMYVIVSCGWPGLPESRMIIPIFTPGLSDSLCNKTFAEIANLTCPMELTCLLSSVYDSRDVKNSVCSIFTSPDIDDGLLGAREQALEPAHEVVVVQHCKVVPKIGRPCPVRRSQLVQKLKSLSVRTNTIEIKHEPMLSRSMSVQ